MIPHRSRLTSILMCLVLAACNGPVPDQDDASSVSTPAASQDSSSFERVELDLGQTLAMVEEVQVGSKEFGQVAARRLPQSGGKYLSTEEKAELLDELIDQKLLYMEARRLGFDQDPKVQRQMIQILLRRTVYSQVRNTDFTNDELRAFYEKEKENFTTPEKLLIRRIFIKVEGIRPEDEATRIAQQAYERVKADPESFAQVAQEVSEDIFQKRGGDLGFVPRSGKANVPDDVVTKAFDMEL
ncbi:MAG: parvulin-like peptidyl-prolyl isomerase, partial [Kiritimatiellia bacterium]